MSELTNTKNGRNDFHWRMLTTVSAAALLASVCTANRAYAADDGPLVWIELGGQFSHLDGDQEQFLPPFLLATPRPPLVTVSPTEIDRAPASSWDGSAKIAFEPTGTDWVFSVGVQYGKGNRSKSVDEVTAYAPPGQLYIAYQNIAAKSSESHTVLDFQAGKDVGLGLFGSDSKSVFSVGLRYAHFNSQSSARIRSQPTNVAVRYGTYNRFYGTFSAQRKFSGLGPSLSWDASANLLGSPSTGSIALDWGVNGSILFGRRQMLGQHRTANILHESIGTPYPHPTAIPVYQRSASPNRSKQVTVPNLGGFAGVSWRYSSAKVSLGYRADMFFGAMDGGIDAAYRENVGFYGPFATVSVGIGG
jgi:hypothetical protein